MYLKAVTLLACVAGSLAIVCTPELCRGVVKEVKCKGSRIAKGGFCGCTDACAGVEGDRCESPSGSKFLGVAPTPPCDHGYECAPGTFGVGGSGVCKKASAIVRSKLMTTSRPNSSTRPRTSGRPRTTPKLRTTPRPASTTRKTPTACERERSVRMISFAIWQGMVIPVCMSDGSYAPKQCDNTQKCFCVNRQTGVRIGDKKPLNMLFSCE